MNSKAPSNPQSAIRTPQSIERWWWLGLFCLASLLIHVTVGWRLPVSMGVPDSFVQAPKEITIELNPERPKPEPKVEPKPEPPKPETPKPEPKVKPEVKPVAKAPTPPKERTLPRGVPFREKVALGSELPRPEPKLPQRDPGGVDPEKPERPLPLGLKTGRRDLRQANPRLSQEPTPATAKAPDRPVGADEQPDAAPGKNVPGPRLSLRTPGAAGDGTNPLTGLGPGNDDRPVGPQTSVGGGALKLAREPRLPTFAGGGSVSPGAVIGGKDGAKGPEEPTRDLISLGSGGGGQNLPRIAPRTGGGGGRMTLSVNNDLAKELVPDDKPGLGPGAGGGAGTGRGGGVGFRNRSGIGTDENSKVAVGTLRPGKGVGIGDGKGDGIGRPAGGGRGTGAELPGTGGSGFGYGKGKGGGNGNGIGPGIASGGGGRGGNPGGGDGGTGVGAGGGTRLGLNRGIPFGSISGLLGGDPNGGGGRGGGPGGPGRGIGGGLPGAGGLGPKVVDRARIVYVLDISTSMREGNKIGKAKDALKKALSELKPGDLFNIISFGGNAIPFAPDIRSADRATVTQALEWVDALEMIPGTNISSAFELALLPSKLTHIFFLSDGEPSRGITQPDILRTFIRERNRSRAQVLVLGLGLGEEFRGIPLLKGIAEDNDGGFSYVNLAR